MIWFKWGWLAEATSSWEVLADLDFLLGLYSDSLLETCPIETLLNKSWKFAGFSECRLLCLVGSSETSDPTDSDTWWWRRGATGGGWGSEDIGTFWISFLQRRGNISNNLRTLKVSTLPTTAGCWRPNFQIRSHSWSFSLALADPSCYTFPV